MYDFFGPKVGVASHRTAVTVTSTAQAITINEGYNTIVLFNAGDNDIYYGGEGVTSSNGVPIYTGEGLIFHKAKSYKGPDEQDELFKVYVVCAATKTSDLRIVEFT